MSNTRVGLRFSPTDEELINFYLKNKILGLVDDTINEINISSYEPESLPALSKIASNDLVWYFFSRKEYTSTKRLRKRATGSGLWKPTGRDRIVKETGGNGCEIGTVKTLVYHVGKVGRNLLRTPWVMQEYNITCLPLEQRTYVICKIRFRGEVENFSSAGSEVGNFSSAGNEVGNFSSAGGDISSDLTHSSVSGLNSIKATTVTEMGKRQQNLPSVQTPVVDSNTVRAANFEKMYQLLQNLPSV